MKSIKKWVLPFVLALMISIPIGTTLGKYTTTLNSTNTNNAIRDFTLSIYYQNLFDDKLAVDYFNSLPKSNIVIGKTSDYESVISGITGVNIGGSIYAYYIESAETVYVLSERPISTYSFDFFNTDIGGIILKCKNITIENCVMNNTWWADAFIQNSLFVDMDYVFGDIDAVTVDISGVDFSAVTNIQNTFYWADTVQNVYFPAMPNLKSISELFENCDALRYIDFSRIDFTNVEITDLFVDCNFTSNVTIKVATEEDKAVLQDAISNNRIVYEIGSPQNDTFNMSLVS